MTNDDTQGAPIDDVVEEVAHEQAPPVGESAALQKERDEYLHGWKRALADLENYKKDHSQRAAELQIFQNVEFFRELLPLFDTLQQTIQHVPPDQRTAGWYQGLIALQSQWKQFMQSHGVTAIASEGEPFNPEFHEAVGTEHDEKQSDGTVLRTLSEGFILHNQTIIRPARVIVNQLT